MSDEQALLETQNNLDAVDDSTWEPSADDMDAQDDVPDSAVVDADAGIPEKFRGKTPDELITMYRNLEGDYTRKSQLLREYERQLREPPDEPNDDGTMGDGTEDDTEERCTTIADAEFHRLLGLGYPNTQETRDAAWEYARQQDAYIQQAIDEGVQSQLMPYAEVIAPALFHRDISGVLDAEPIYGVEAHELAQQVAQAGISPLEWSAAQPEQRANFIRAAAQQLAYQRFINGELVPPGMAATAPPQDPPSSLHGEQTGTPRLNPMLERQVDHLMTTMGLDRSAALDILTAGA